MEDHFEPYISAERDMPEFSMKAIIVGILITLVMGAANAYLGLFVGMTVSATIPSLVFALAILKIFKGNILEINMSKNIGVAGEALAAGIIFTFPAMLIIRSLPGNEAAGWGSLIDPVNLGIMVIIALVGGLFGIMFTIPLRKVFIEDLDLPYPEGVAAAEVLKAMEKGGRGIYYILIAAGIGGFMKFASTSGLSLWKEQIQGVFPSATSRIKLFGGVNVSPALLGVGYIIGPKISFIVFSGGILGWVIALPIIGYINNWTYEDPITGMEIYYTGVDAIMKVWFEETKWIGIGAVLTGGTYTLWSMRKTLVQSIKQTLGGKKSAAGEPAPIRTERDFHVSPIYLGIIFIVVVGIYLGVTGEFLTSIILAVVMMIATFFFTAVAGYLAGIVGSSNNPISSVTITTLVLTAFVLLGLSAVGLSNLSDPMGATILVAAVVCCSAAIAGDSMQELKTAQILGATPVRIQWGRFIGVGVGALAIPFVVAVLAEAFEIGSPALPAPQAVIMGSTVDAIFGGGFNYIMFGIGVVLAAILIWRKLPVMAVAIGIYLPFTLTTPIAIGGLLGWISQKIVAGKTRLYDAAGLSGEQLNEKIKENKEETFNKGLLFAAGLVAGEAVLGVIVAVIIVVGLPIKIFGNPSMVPGILGLLFIMFLIIYMVVREHVQGLSMSQIFRT
ncbi:MAG: oligopeptide transporter, OPT family, partial [Thermoplasmatota archaeon]